MPDPAPTAEHDRPDRVLAIAFTPRSGSTLLARALEATGIAGRPHEVLGSKLILLANERLGVLRLTPRGRLGRIRRRLQGTPQWELTHRYTDRSFEQYLRAITPEVTTNGVFSLKVYWPEYWWSMLRRGLDLGWWGVPVMWVLVTRGDRLRQACSFVRARQTGWWEADVRESVPAESDPRYDAELIRGAMAELDAQEAAWDAYFATQGVEPLRLRYEQIAADYEGSVRAVLTHLGVDAIHVPPPRLERQADHLTEEWARRFEADAG